MAWTGWFEYEGTEIISGPRTEAYAHNAGAHWFRPVFDNDYLAPILGDGERYSSPLQDEAPWVDPDRPDSYDFFGAYPLDVAGIEDSSATGEVVETLGEGGYVAGARLGTKTVVFSLALIGSSDAAVEYGLNWLKKATGPGACAPRAGTWRGGQLCFLSSEPVFEFDVPADVSPVEPIDPLSVYDGGRPFTRVWSDVADGGTTDAAGLTIVDGGIQGNYELSYDAGTPTETGVVVYDGGASEASGVEVLDGGPVAVRQAPTDRSVTDRPTQGFDVNAIECLARFLRSMHQVRFISGPSVTAKRDLTDGGAVWTVQMTATAGLPYQFSAEVPVIEGFGDPEVVVPWYGGVVPEGGFLDLDGLIHTDENCGTPVYQPVFDPLCPAMIPPPQPPSIKLGCYQPPANWRRRQITIPKQMVPLWGDMVPVVEVHARHHDVRNLRLRFYSDPDGNGQIAEDPCGYCGDLVISYVPQGHTMVMDGINRSIAVLDAGGRRRRADSLVFATDGSPFDWPELTCGIGYVVAFDLPQQQQPPVIDLSLYQKIA